MRKFVQGKILIKFLLNGKPIFIINGNFFDVFFVIAVYMSWYTLKHIRDPSRGLLLLIKYVKHILKPLI